MLFYTENFLQVRTWDKHDSRDLGTDAFLTTQEHSLYNFQKGKKQDRNFIVCDNGMVAIFRASVSLKDVYISIWQAK